MGTNKRPLRDFCNPKTLKALEPYIVDGKANEHSQDPRTGLLIILDSSHDPYACICTIFMVPSHDTFMPHVSILFSFYLLLYATPYVSFMHYVLSYVVMTRHVPCLYLYMFMPRYA